MTKHRRRRSEGVVLLLWVALLVACGEDTTEPETASGGRPAAEVAALLVAPESLGEGWSTLVDPGGDVDFETGIVTDDNRSYLPRVEVCPNADEDAAKAATQVEWQAFRQYTYDTGMPEVTEPTPGVRPQHHLVFVQEFLLSDDQASVAETYDALAAGFAACPSGETTSPDGETIITRPMTAPEVGDAATALRTTVTEPGGGGGPVWDLRNVIWRDADLLVAVTVAEIASPKIERVLDEAAVQGILDAIEGALT
jgi:hypothetical protein